MILKNMIQCGCLDIKHAFLLQTCRWRLSFWSKIGAGYGCAPSHGYRGATALVRRREGVSHYVHLSRPGLKDCIIDSFEHPIECGQIWALYCIHAKLPTEIICSGCHCIVFYLYGYFNTGKIQLVNLYMHVFDYFHVLVRNTLNLIICWCLVGACCGE